MSWKDFANNFNAVYGAFNDTFRDMDAADIADWEVEDELDANGVATGKKLYGGQVLPDNYTQTDLDRMQYKALSDVYTKYGDAAGGLKMRLDANRLDKERSETDVQLQTAGNQVTNSDTSVLQNQANVADTQASTANKIANTKFTNTKTEGQQQANIAAIRENEWAALKFDQDKLQNNALLEYQANVKNGVYKTQEEGYQDYISKLKNINPEIGAAMEAKYNAQDLKKILDGAAKTSAEVQKSLTEGYGGKVGIDAAIAYIDDKNGLDIGVEKRARDGGGFAIVATGKNGEVLDVISEGRDETDLKNGLFYWSSPGGSVKLSEQIYANQLTESQIKKNNKSGGGLVDNQKLVTNIVPFTDGTKEDLEQKVNDASEVLKGLNSKTNTNSGTGYVDMGNGLRGKKKENEEEIRYGRR